MKTRIARATRALLLALRDTPAPQLRHVAIYHYEHANARRARIARRVWFALCILGAALVTILHYLRR